MGAESVLIDVEPSALRVHFGGVNQNVPIGAFQPLVFTTVDFDRLGEYNLAVGTFTPARAGWYQITLKLTTLNFTPPNTLNIRVFMTAPPFGNQTDSNLNLVAGQTAMTIENNGLLYLTPAQTIQAQVFIGNSGMPSVDGSAWLTYLAIHRVR